jgi:formate hydrogenlyase subunit 3/multisubunit Na+/H+ antiporter MnhD subunit
MLYFNNNLKLILSNTNHSQQNSFYFYILLLTSISGLPPFPLFFIKVMIIRLLFFNGLVGVLVLLFVLLANVILIVSYFQFMFFIFINQKTRVFGQYFTF